MREARGEMPPRNHGATRGYVRRDFFTNFNSGRSCRTLPVPATARTTRKFSSRERFLPVRSIAQMAQGRELGPLMLVGGVRNKAEHRNDGKRHQGSGRPLISQNLMFSAAENRRRGGVNGRKSFLFRPNRNADRASSSAPRHVHCGPTAHVSQSSGGLGQQQDPRMTNLRRHCGYSLSRLSRWAGFSLQRPRHDGGLGLGVGLAWLGLAWLGLAWPWAWLGPGSTSETDRKPAYDAWITARPC
jgi:hypothetical protein